MKKNLILQFYHKRSTSTHLKKEAESSSVPSSSPLLLIPPYLIRVSPSFTSFLPLILTRILILLFPSSLHSFPLSLSPLHFLLVQFSPPLLSPRLPVSSSIMLHHCLLVIGALLSLAVPLLVAMETCPATGMPGMPGIPGMPGKDGRDGEKGEKGRSGTPWDGGVGPQKGEKGEPGQMGWPGKRGQSGEQGISGLPGVPGNPGEPGDPGTAGIQPKAAFSVARGTNEYPDKSSVIRFTSVITNLNDDYSTETGRFRCRVPGTYYFVFHASLEDRLCVLMKLDDNLLTPFCDHRRNRRQVTSGSLAVYLSRGQEVWLETKDYRGMRGKPAGYSIFSGFLLHSH